MTATRVSQGDPLVKKPTSRRDAAALKWKPRLKNAPRDKRSTSTSATTNVADQALSAMRRIDQVRGVGGDVEDAAARIAGRYLPQAGAEALNTKRAPAPVRTGRRGGRNALVAGLALATACIVAMFVLGRSTPRHTVVGRVYLERKPLGSAELRFHPGGNGSAAMTVVAAQDGEFRLKDIAAGDYRVTIHPPSGPRAVPLAAAYAHAETTPLHVHLIQDIDRLRLYASRVAPTPGGE